MRNIVIAIVMVIVFIIVKSNVGYFMYDGSARTTSKSINYQIGQ